ncbi:abscisic acid receptor PYL4-like [Rhododendron vialii]|uniref:abscisic acid receptor PYL4-like n=1 Tax=Rhododendron vialii TaxID=182163 RepID=UPI00265FE3F5|nr:abscisic acid receptor PYL4-like [Rhododendron vialii]
MPTSLNHHRTNEATSNHQKQPPPPPQPQTTYTCPLPPSLSLLNDAALCHTHLVGPNQCCSALVQPIAAPLSAVWPVLRRFDDPCAYKHFLKSCRLIAGDGGVGTLREIHVVSGLPAASSTERLEVLDDESHVVGFSIVGGDHRLNNYRSVTSLHRSAGGLGTVVVESYVVDVPPGNTKEETCGFVDTIVRCNLQSLAQLTENLGPKKPLVLT